MGILKKGEDKKKLAFNNLMTAVSGMNPNKIKHLTEDDLNDPEPLSLSEGREKKEEEVKESSEPDKKEDQEAPARSEAEEKKEQLSSSKENEKKEEEVKESSEPDKKEDQEAPARSEAEEKKEQLSSSKETQDVQSPFSYENIIRKSNIEDGQFTTFKLKRETLDMLDAIARGSEKNVSKSTIIHNLVSTFLNENIERLKMVASKKIKKDYLK